jgi:GAF domain-containing protein
MSEEVLNKTFVVEDDFERRGLSQAERANSKALGMRAMVASTVRRGERNPISSMAAVSSRPRRWRLGEIALVEETAERTWAAMERALAESTLRESEEKYLRFGSVAAARDRA